MLLRRCNFREGCHDNSSACCRRGGEAGPARLNTISLRRSPTLFTNHPRPRSRCAPQHKHIRTLEVLRELVDENNALRDKLNVSYLVPCTLQKLSYVLVLQV